MKKSFHEPELGSSLILADNIDELRNRNSHDYFKILWNRGDSFRIEMESLNITLQKNDLICLTPLQKPEFPNPSARYYLLQFNREFYCIHENDDEVSCEGLLFWGSSELPILGIDEEEVPKFETIFRVFIDELDTKDKIQGEMLRMLLKRLIIKSTRLARQQHFPDELDNSSTELIRQFNILVEQHFKEHHQVSSYAEMLHKSPKTLSNVFASAGHRSPLEVIHHRIAMEGKRQLLKTDKLAKEIAFDLGFRDQSHFSRFFKKETGISPSQYRRKKN
ncbi:AraC family transcriptional regulator [Balneolaceae bacterium YR4-1]|uniref:AraC family transcriptional regulator n=1 Tax=Halalkalibaculum roseum TaxID=2709311 RepID=A0A6M1SY21_9BACT|nr:helix-turn-helix domain-containing protein [Halalkalibaculum roseum]NGP78000.1 AraC family transcriptional regulator [Halalkalibaculum roseum]